jgi:type II secretory pathway component PulM
LLLHEVAAELGATVMMEPAGLESSIENAERIFQEVQDLLAKVRSTLDRVRDISAPESTSTTMAGVLEALSVKETAKIHWLLRFTER